MTTCYHARFIQWGNAFPESITPKDELPTHSLIYLDCDNENEIEEALINTLEREWHFKVDKIYWERARLWRNF